MANNNFNPADNLSEGARREGGEASSQEQNMSKLGKKAGEARSRKTGGSRRGRGGSR